MKTLHLITIGLITLFSQSSYADSIDRSINCCPASMENVNMELQVQQQYQLDQIQHESEDMIMHVSESHLILQKKMSEKLELSASMLNMQSETENIYVESLQQIAQKVDRHVAVNVKIVSR